MLLEPFKAKTLTTAVAAAGQVLRMRKCIAYPQVVLANQHPVQPTLVGTFSGPKRSIGQHTDQHECSVDLAPNGVLQVAQHIADQKSFRS